MAVVAAVGVGEQRAAQAVRLMLGDQADERLV